MPASLRSRVDGLLSRWPRAYAAALGWRRGHDPDKRLFLRLLGAGDVVFDVGANLGHYTRLFARLVGRSGAVHAFEPVPETFARLQGSLADEGPFPNVMAVNAALAERAGPVLMHLPGDDHGQASLQPHGAGSWVAPRGVSTRRCMATTLDAYVDSQGLRRLDLVKCDVEGAELLVLRGGTAALRRLRPLLHLEVFLEWSKDFGYSPDELGDFLRGQGYDTLLVVARRGLRRMDQHLVAAAAVESVNVLAGAGAIHGGRLAGLVGA